MGSFVEHKRYPTTGLRVLTSNMRDGKMSAIMFLDLATFQKLDKNHQSAVRDSIRSLKKSNGKLMITLPIERIDDFDLYNAMLEEFGYKEPVQRGFKRRKQDVDYDVFSLYFDFGNGFRALAGRPKNKKLYLLTMSGSVKRIDKKDFDIFSKQLREDFGFFYRNGMFQKWSEEDYDKDYWESLKSFLIKFYPIISEPKDEPKEETYNKQDVLNAIAAIEVIVSTSTDPEELKEAKSAIEALELLLPTE